MARSFRSAEDQAEWAAREVREASYDDDGGGYTTSLSTINSYESVYKDYVDWQRSHGDYSGIKGVDSDGINEYLQSRSTEVGQSQLDQDRQALTAFAAARGIDTSGVERAMSEKEVPADALSQVSRVYSGEQIAAIMDHQTDRNALATAVAAEAGLRGHELLTIERAQDRPASERPWSENRWAGREDGERYTVIGKGGLCREVALSKDVADALESRRLDTPQQVTDRGIFYEKQYDIGGGQAWSMSFTRASQNALGFSLGSHSMRHTFVDERLQELQSLGYTMRDAEALVSQEVGHFRPEITSEHYIRKT